MPSKYENNLLTRRLAQTLGAPSRVDKLNNFDVFLKKSMKKLFWQIQSLWQF